MKLNKIIIAGGGTGGHIFPAIAVANALRRIDASIQVLFIGAKGKMEMEKVPQAGYRIEGLDIAGFNRASLLKNWSLPFKLIKSFYQVRKIFQSFEPDAVFGVGGYSSFPVLKYAQSKDIPTFLHEANSFAGKSNIMLGKKAALVMVATAGMEKFFPAEKLVRTGNPVRREIAESTVLREEALEFFGIKGGKPTVLVIGGSLGARSINNAIAKQINKFFEAGVQLIWQTGKGNLELVSAEIRNRKDVCVTEFITKMNYAYAAADVVVSRAGAIALAEICACGKPSVLVPYPHAAEDHQTVNASILANNGAALMVPDETADQNLVDALLGLVADKEKCERFGTAASKLYVENADMVIAEHIIQILEKEMVELIDIADIRKAYFIGIGGIGMSAIARFFHDRGVKVSGYDKTATALTHALSAEGIEIHYTDEASVCPADADVIVYTPAIPKDNKIIAYCRQQQMNLLKRSDILQVISKGTFNICIAGTHGKTTTSTMVAHILRDTSFGCNAFLGGISTNYHTNFWSDPNPVCVIEADEYDRSFLKLYPNIISVSSMDADHLDIYGTASAMEDAFIQFAGNLKTNGLLLTRKGLNREDEFKSAGHLTYALDDAAADIHAFSLQINNGSYVYGVKGKDWEMEGLRLNMGGMHNVENSLVAIAIAKHLGIEDEKIKSAVASFAGVKRRFEYIVRTSSLVYIDDYAHHPEELRALITGAKDMYPSKKCTVIFQPHLFTRTRDLVDGFAASLDLADEIILLPIYPARELPIEGVNSEMIMKRMKGKVVLKHMHELEALITEMQPELLLTAGAGDIDTMIQPLKNAMLNR